MEKYIEIIGLILSGTGLKIIFDFIIARRGQSKTDIDTVIGIYKDDNDRLRQQEEILSKRVFELEKRVNELQNSIIMLESSYFELPFPTWIKDTSGRMMALNKAYEDIILNPAGRLASEYIGKTDEEMWGRDIGKFFKNNDVRAKMSFTNYWIGEIDISKHFHNAEDGDIWTIVKYNRKVGTVLIGVAGMLIPKK